MLLRKPNTAVFALSLVLATAGMEGLRYRGLAGDNQPGTGAPLGSGPPRLQVEHKNILTHVAWSPDGKRVATGTNEGTISIIDVASGKEVQSFKAGTAPVEIAFSPDGKRLAVLQGGQAFGIWDVNMGKSEQRNGGTSTRKADHVAFTPDGQVVVLVGVGSLYEWRNFGASTNSTVVGTNGGFAAVAPDGSVGGWCEENGLCRFYRYEPNYPRLRLTVLQVGTARCIAFGPGGKLLAIGGDEKDVQLWDLTKKKPATKLDGLQKPAKGLGFSADGKTLAALSDDGGSIRVWDLSRNTTRCQITHNRGEVGAFVLSPDGKMLATTVKGGNVLCLWTTSARHLSRPEPPLELAAKEMTSLWTELANADYEKADAAWRKLGQAGDNAIPFLRDQIRPIAVPAVDRKQIDKLVSDLNADKFSTREHATKELLALGELAIVPLQRVLEKPPSQEARERASLLLKKVAEPLLSPDRQRVLDAIELLEQLGTAKAHALLKEIERDALISQIRTQAKHALERHAAVVACKPAMLCYFGALPFLFIHLPRRRHYPGRTKVSRRPNHACGLSRHRDAQLRALAAAGHFQSLNDGQLLELFAADRDELAFKTLVRRHGPLVFGVCRRFLRPGRTWTMSSRPPSWCWRKAGSIRWQASVANWLFGVTFRLCRKRQARLGAGAARTSWGGPGNHCGDQANG